MQWIKSDYAKHSFFVERDFVWTVQKKLTEILAREQSQFNLFNDYPIEPGSRRSICVDLAVASRGICYKDVQTGEAQLEFVAEFKFEPSKVRPDIMSHKLPVVEWSAVLEDINRIRRYVGNRSAKTGVSVFIDELGLNRSRPVDSHSQWLDWGPCNLSNLNLSVLWTTY